MRSVPSRLRLSSTALSIQRGLAPLRLGSPPFSEPNLVAMMTSSRRELRALPRYSSDEPSPYASAVSKKLMPTSIAARTTASVPDLSRRRPKLLQPTPTVVTSRSPILRVSITVFLLPGKRPRLYRFDNYSLRSSFFRSWNYLEVTGRSRLLHHTSSPCNEAIQP